MKKRFFTYYTIFSIVFDGLLVVAALWVAQMIYPIVGQYLYNSNSLVPQVIIHPINFAFFAFVWVAVLSHLGAYELEKNLRVVDEIYTIISAATITAMIIAGFLYLFNSPLHFSAFLLFVIIAILFLTFYRLVYRLVFQKKIRQLTYQSRILIAGAGEVGRRFERDIDDFSEVGYTLVGFVDDDPDLIKSRPDVLGSIDQVHDLINAYQIDNLIIALPHGAYQRIDKLMQSIQNLPVRVWVIPDFFALMLSRSSVWNFVGVPMMTLRASALNKRQRISKRLFDLVVSSIVFLASLPILLLVSLLIKINSAGPIFYRSTRLKENGQTFEMLKFRTMVMDADEKFQDVLQKDKNGRFIHKKPDDPRVTRVGKWLRKTSLDELPQLINILKGDMSLVGPRPELPELVEYYKPWQYIRFAVPQGLTGWWQVNGRSDKPMHLHTDEDLYYIQHYSLWLDIQILIKTVLVVLRGKGAY